MTAAAMRAVVATALLLPLPALAQVGDSVTLNAVAELELAPDPPLELGALNALSFGVVTIPNKALAGVTCAYVVDDQSTGRVSETTTGTNRDEPVGGTTPSGCRYVKGPTAGRVRVMCLSLRTVTINVSFTPATANSLRLGRGRVTIDRPTGSGATLREVVNGVSAECVPRDRQLNGELTEMLLRVGGSLNVTQDYNLPLKTGIVVGTIKVDAVYS